MIAVGDCLFFFFFQAEDGIRDYKVTGVQTCALPIWMKGEPYQRPPYPITWARQQGKGRVFYTAMGHLPETWENEFFLSLVAGGIAWAMGHAKASIDANIAKVAPGYAQIPVLTPAKQ